MKQWEVFEGFLYDWTIAGHSAFTCEDVSKFLEVSTTEASRLIQAYQEAMLIPGSSTLFVIGRQGRTTNAIWFIGTSVKDLRRVSAQFSDDIVNRIVTHLTPWVELISEKNPNARKRATRIQIQIGRLVQQLEDLAA